MTKLQLVLLGMLMGGAAGPAYANWSLNIGYHNPMNANLGVNFLYWGSQWNFEIGIGALNADAETKDNNSKTADSDKLGASAAGDVNVKYRFTSGSVAPYIQVGLGAATGAAVGDQGGAGANLGGPFAGLGLMFGKATFYGYGAYNLNSSHDGEFQAGIGFGI